MPETRHDFYHVWNVYMPFAIGVFATFVTVLIGLLIYGHFFRKEPGKRAEANPVEASYAIILLCIAGFLIFWTFHTENREDPVIKHPGLRIAVVAAQWSWRFTYPNGKVVTAVDTWKPPVAEVPLNTEVQITGYSKDVIHGFWIPKLRFQRQFIPGESTSFDLIFREPGRYFGECSVYCGLRHSQMHFEMKAVSHAAFEKWVNGSAA